MSIIYLAPIVGILLIIANLYIDYNLRKYSRLCPQHELNQGRNYIGLAMALKIWMLSISLTKKNIQYRDDGGYTICKNFR